MNDQEYMCRVRRLEARLYRIAQAMLWRHADCSDAVQEAVFRGWLKKNNLHETDFFETWLIRILINECKDQLKRRGREVQKVMLEPTAEDRMCDDLHLRMALRRLPEKYRLPLVLHYLEGLTVKEVAVTLGLTPTRVNTRLSQARKNLRTLLDGGRNEDA